jgi:hypothetical protein
MNKKKDLKKKGKTRNFKLKILPGKDRTTRYGIWPAISAHLPDSCRVLAVGVARWPYHRCQCHENLMKCAHCSHKTPYDAIDWACLFHVCRRAPLTISRAACSLSLTLSLDTCLDPRRYSPGIHLQLPNKHVHCHAKRHSSGSCHAKRLTVSSPSSVFSGTHTLPRAGQSHTHTHTE